MGLLHLLTVAKSLNTPKSGPNKYRLNQYALPKFAQGKSSLTLRPAPLSKPSPSAVAESLFDPRPSTKVVPVRVAPATPEPDPGPTPFRPTLKEVTPPSPSAVGPANSVGSEVKSAKRPKRNVRRILQEAAFLRRKPSHNLGRAVQTEWALDQVAVVRNSLVDSDVEVVPAAPAASATTSDTQVEEKPVANIFSAEQKTEEKLARTAGWKGWVERARSWATGPR